MRAAVAIALALGLLAGGGAPAAAGAPGQGAEVASALSSAQDALAAGDYQQAAKISGPLTKTPAPLARGDRAEAWRIYGLAQFFLGERVEAEASLLAFLKLDPDASLDPTLVPPEAVVFFEDVRVRHAGELQKVRSRPKVPKYVWLNLVPAGGQFQNGDRVKGWVVAGASTALLAASVSTFVMLRANCGRKGPAGPFCKNWSAARVEQAVNITTGVGFAGVYIYSIVDGFLGYRRLKEEAAAWERQGAVSVGVSPAVGGASVSLSGRF